MNTAHKTDKEKEEFFDSEQELDEKITTLAEWIKASKHFVAFTGAGISTGAGIPDFRSGVNTVLPTGPGAWEKQATKSNAKPKVYQPIISAVPTACHMSLVKLLETGHLKYLISQNVDGLHRKSGIPAKSLAELHGNCNLEICKNDRCKKQYLRDYDINGYSARDHRTGNKCENCGKELYDNIINFGENLPEKELLNGFDHSEKADLCLVLGSSLRVTPAAHMPRETVKNGGKLVIVNLQATPLDDGALRINGLIDDVMVRLMKKLDITIPQFTLKRRVSVTKCESSNKFLSNKIWLKIQGVDEEGSPYSLFRSVDVLFPENKKATTFTKEPVEAYYTKASKGEAKITMKFQGHYGEEDFVLNVPLEGLKPDEPIYYFIEYNIWAREWISCKQIFIEK